MEKIKLIDIKNVFPPESPHCHYVDDYSGLGSACQIIHCTCYAPVSVKQDEFPGNFNANIGKVVLSVFGFPRQFLLISSGNFSIIVPAKRPFRNSTVYQNPMVVL